MMNVLFPWCIGCAAGSWSSTNWVSWRPGCCSRSAGCPARAGRESRLLIRGAASDAVFGVPGLNRSLLTEEFLHHFLDAVVGERALELLLDLTLPIEDQNGRRAVEGEFAPPEFPFLVQDQILDETRVLRL